MSNLKCNASNCINNAHGLCSRPIIRVDGDNAQKSYDTFCHSFNHRMGNMQNAISGGGSAEEHTDIKCTACECKYNSDNYCTADDVEVLGGGACRCGETECKTFKKK